MLTISMWHFRNSCCVTQSWSILVFVQENWFHSFCGVAEDIPLFSFPVPAALSTTLKNLISGRKEECLQVLCLLMLPVHLFFRAKVEPGTSVSQILVLLFCSKWSISLSNTLLIVWDSLLHKPSGNQTVFQDYCICIRGTFSWYQNI